MQQNEWAAATDNPRNWHMQGHNHCPGEWTSYTLSYGATEVWSLDCIAAVVAAISHVPAYGFSAHPWWYELHCCCCCYHFPLSAAAAGCPPAVCNGGCPPPPPPPPIPLRSVAPLLPLPFCGTACCYCSCPLAACRAPAAPPAAAIVAACLLLFLPARLLPPFLPTRLPCMHF